MSKNEIDYARLSAAIHQSRRAQEYQRRVRTDMLREIAGKYYSDNSADRHTPLNVMSLFSRIFGKKLAPNSPRVMISTMEMQRKPMVKIMERWINQEIERARLGKVFERTINDAFIWTGVTKVALADPADVARYAWSIGAGKPYACNVSFDDFVWDQHCRDLREASWVGHRIRVPLDIVKDSKLYTKARKDLTPTVDKIYNQQGDERAASIGRGQYNQWTEEFEDFIDLWQIYIARYKLVCTFADQDMGEFCEPIREQNWIGPSSGPFHYLGYQIIPDNPLHKGPLHDGYDAHLFVNRAARKMYDQTDRAKDMTFVRGAADSDGRRVVEADDGDVIRVDDPASIAQVSMGGANPKIHAAMQWWFQVSKQTLGNLDAVGGLSPGAKTATQDKLLTQTASEGIQDLQVDTIEHVSDVISALCWYWHNDPSLTMRVEHSIPGIPEATIIRKSDPRQRAAVAFEDLGIRIDPYSLQHDTPQGRLAMLQGVMQSFVLPLMGPLEKQGVMVDLHAMLDKIATYGNMPDLPEILTIREPPTADTQTTGPQQSAMPQETTRNYVRQSDSSTKTQEGEAANMMQGLMGMDSGGAPEES